MNMRLYVSSVEFLLLLTVFAVVVSKKIHSADTLHRFLLTAEGYASLRNSSEAYCLDSVDGNISKQALMKSRGCVIYYLHTHKTGGSTLCHTAARAGHTVNMRLNCNVEGNKRADWHDFIQKQNLTFAAQENGVFIPERNRYNYLYMTTVRDPFDRIVSHLHMDMCDVTYKQALRFVKASNCHFDPRNATFDDVVMSDCFMTNLTGITSNFYLFHFSGCRYPNCNERDLKLAKNRLEAMSVVMITDTRQQFDSYSRLLALKFSMPYSESSRAGTTHNSRARQSVSEASWKRLKALNALDEEFYAHAKVVASKQLDDWQMELMEREEASKRKKEAIQRDMDAKKKKIGWKMNAMKNRAERAKKPPRGGAHSPKSGRYLVAEENQMTKSAHRPFCEKFRLVGDR